MWVTASHFSFSGNSPFDERISVNSRNWVWMCSQRRIPKCFEQRQHLLVTCVVFSKMTSLNIYVCVRRSVTYTFALKMSEEFIVGPHAHTLFIHFNCLINVHFSLWYPITVHLFQRNSPFHLWNSVSTLYKSPLLLTAWVWSRSSVRKGRSLIHSKDLIHSFVSRHFPRKDATNHALLGVASKQPLQSCRTKASVWLWGSPGLPWWPPAVNIWNHFPLGKATQTELPVPVIGPRDVAKGGTGRVLVTQKEESTWAEGTSSTGGITNFFFSKITWHDISVEASKKISAGMGALLHLCFS